jgi:hypothetical protein
VSLAFVDQRGIGIVRVTSEKEAEIREMCRKNWKRAEYKEAAANTSRISAAAAIVTFMEFCADFTMG